MIDLSLSAGVYEVCPVYSWGVLVRVDVLVYGSGMPEDQRRICEMVMPMLEDFGQEVRKVFIFIDKIIIEGKLFTQMQFWHPPVYIANLAS